MKYIELCVNVKSEWIELVSDILINQVGCSGVVTEEVEFKDEEVVKQSLNIIKGYLWYNEKRPLNIEHVQNILWQNRSGLVSLGENSDELGSWNIDIKEVDDEDWAHSWKKYWHPQKIGSKIVICPSWEDYSAQDDEIIIELDPGTAFGTGTHPTTRLCIVGLEKYVSQGLTIADVGTGSGILSIVGAKLGAKTVVGVDNDPSVIEVAQSNALKNNVSEECSFFEGSTCNINDKFDIVLANILAEVIVSIMDDLISILKPDGKMILSGIIEEKAYLVKNALSEKGMKLLKL
ncbi:MAG: 50S ribosomal protein L11 methyltransferase [Bacillus subtilis]|nr:50S ribosomal protein L11 methyltransferase [Bacillus subtilis]